MVTVTCDLELEEAFLQSLADSCSQQSSSKDELCTIRLSLEGSTEALVKSESASDLDKAVSVVQECVTVEEEDVKQDGGGGLRGEEFQDGKGNETRGNVAQETSSGEQKMVKLELV